MQKLIEKMLPFYYIFMLLILIGGGLVMYNIKVEQRNRLLTIEENLDIEEVGENVQLELNEDNKNEKVVYEVVDENVVKVSEEGELVSVGEGSTEVTVKSEDGTKSQTIVVNVGSTAIKEYEKQESIKTQNSSSNNKPNNNSSSSSNNKPNNNSGSSSNNTTNNNSGSSSNNKPNNNSGSSSNNTTNNNSGSSSNNKPNNNSGSSSNNTTNNNSGSSSNNKPNNNSGSSSNNTTNNNSGSSSGNNNVTNKVVNVTGVSLNRTSAEIHLNTNTKTVSLVATVSPSNATNKNVTWSSSNNNIATVSNGVVTAKNPGVVTISAKTQDGGKVASATITVKKNVIIVIGASQVTRMAWYKTSYSSSKYNYNTSDQTLVYVNKSGSGIDYQTGEGFNSALSKMSSISATGKAQVNFYIYFPLSGNTIKNFTCAEISQSNTKIIGYVNNYNNSIKKLLNSGYKVKGYVVSMHPVRVSQSNNKYVVVNENANSCKQSYRSNRKYYDFNRATKGLISNLNPKYIQYESLFIKIMTVTDKNKNYSYNMTYNTTDGVHWDAETTRMYVDMMLNYSGDL